MKRLPFIRSFLFGVGAFGLAAVPVFAQVNAADADYGANADDAQTAPDNSRATSNRTGYAHVTAAEGSGAVLSDANGRTEMQINLPLSESDQMVTNSGGRAEIELADGNRVQIGSDTRVRLDALAGEQGSQAAESGLTLLEGSLAVESASLDRNRAFRVDTPDASVYVRPGAQARINLDPNRGTSVIVRSGAVDLQTRSGAIPVQAGQYALIHGEDQPELARGSFSRDRFDVWVADRSQRILQAHNSVSAQYVDGEDYDEDVAALDDYGSWDNSSTYGSRVWRPRVSAGWSPYSDGYWYYTPVGATWVDYQPWGWFPHHFGNWFFDVAFGSWCWSPAYAYSPAWVYWGYSGGYTGWCPLGYYSGFAPYGSYWGGWGSGLYFSVHGIFDRGRIDCGRGWNFVGNDSFGSRFDRRSILPGTQMASRLGSQIAVTSNPLRVPLVSGRGSAGSALRAYARTAPALIARQSSRAESSTLTPFLARQRTLPADTVRALRQTQVARVDPSSRTLRGPGASRLSGAAPPAMSGRTPATRRSLDGGAFGNPGSSRTESWRNPGRSTVPGSPRTFSNPPGRSFSSPGSSRGTIRPDAPRSDWRNRSSNPAPRYVVAPPASSRRSLDRPQADGWRNRNGSFRSAPDSAPRSYPESGPRAVAPGNSSESWRVRPNAPPAQRVIEGIDRGRALPPSRRDDYARPLPDRRPSDSRPSALERRAAPAPRFERQAPPPAYDRRAEPAPRYERPAPAPRVERRAEPPSREMRAAPPARESRSPAPNSSRSAPAPHREYRSSDGRSHG